MVATTGFQSGRIVSHSMRVGTQTRYTTGARTLTAKFGQQRIPAKDRLEASLTTDCRDKATRMGSDSPRQQSQSKPRRLLEGIDDARR